MIGKVCTGSLATHMSALLQVQMFPHCCRVCRNRRRMGKFHRIADRREVERDG